MYISLKKNKTTTRTNFQLYDLLKLIEKIQLCIVKYYQIIKYKNLFIPSIKMYPLDAFSEIWAAQFDCLLNIGIETFYLIMTNKLNLISLVISQWPRRNVKQRMSKRRWGEQKHYSSPFLNHWIHKIVSVSVKMSDKKKLSTSVHVFTL